MTVSQVAYADSLNSSASDLFEDQGYVVVRGLLDDDQDVQPVRDEYDALLDSLAAQWREEGVVSSTYEDLPFERRLAALAAEGAPYARAFDISLSAGTGLMHRGPAVFNLLRSPRLLDGAELFIGPELYSNPVQHVRIKVPERIIPDDRRDALNSKSPWHQDMAVVRPEADDTEMLTVWVAISDATEENGCLVVAPESHREGMALHCKTGGSIPEEVVGDNRLPLVMESGDVLFMSKGTKHASLTNVSDGVRFSFDLRYNPVGQPTGRPWFPGFVARSRSNPESEVRDFEEWDRLWNEAKAALEAVDYKTPDNPYLLTAEQDPRCA